MALFCFIFFIRVLGLVHATNRKLFFSLVCAGLYSAFENSVDVFILLVFCSALNMHSVLQRKIPKYISHTTLKELS